MLMPTCLNRGLTGSKRLTTWERHPSPQLPLVPRSCGRVTHSLMPIVWPAALEKAAKHKRICTCPALVVARCCNDLLSCRRNGHERVGFVWLAIRHASWRDRLVVAAQRASLLRHGAIRVYSVGRSRQKRARQRSPSRWNCTPHLGGIASGRPWRLLQRTVRGQLQRRS